MPFLEHDGVTRELPLGDTMVGGGSQADWRLQLINLAPRHFTVRVDGSGGAVLTAYGTQVVEINGVATAAPHPLAHGDEVIAGAGIFVYLARIDGAGAIAAEASAASAASAAAPVIPEMSSATAGSGASATPPESPGAAGTATRDAGLAPAYLVDATGSHVYPLVDDLVGIGRDPVNHVVLRDAATSRFHADVRRAPTGAYVFRSLGANGSTVNETLAGRTPRALAEGDVIRIGGATLRFTTAPPPGARVVPRSDVAPGPRAHQPTPIYRSDEPNTVPPPIEPRAGGRGRLIAIIAGVLLAVAVAYVAWMMRGGLRH